jgi:hypothetical protein
MEPAAYIQDHWIVGKMLALDPGIRWEAQTITSTVRVAPRAGVTWSSNRNTHNTVLRGGMGVYYDEVPLNVYAFRNYPLQTITTYGAAARRNAANAEFGSAAKLLRWSER